MVKTKINPTARSKKAAGPEPIVEESSGNVFADLGLPNPEQELAKAHLAIRIRRIIEDRKLTQAQAAGLLGIHQPHVSQLMRNRAGNYSVGRLLEFLTLLGQNVEIKVTPSLRKQQGAVSVTFVQQ